LQLNAAWRCHPPGANDRRYTLKTFECLKVSSNNSTSSFRLAHKVVDEGEKVGVVVPTLPPCSLYCTMNEMGVHRFFVSPQGVFLEVQWSPRLDEAEEEDSLGTVTKIETLVELKRWLEGVAPDRAKSFRASEAVAPGDRHVIKLVFGA
jgi:hypothetical protein